MDKPFVGHEKKYAENYDSIFRKPLKQKLIEKINIWLYNIFIKDDQEHDKR